MGKSYYKRANLDNEVIENQSWMGVACFRNLWGKVLNDDRKTITYTLPNNYSWKDAHKWRVFIKSCGFPCYLKRKTTFNDLNLPNNTFEWYVYDRDLTSRKQRIVTLMLIRYLYDEHFNNIIDKVYELREETDWTDFECLVVGHPWGYQRFDNSNHIITSSNPNYLPTKKEYLKYLKTDQSICGGFIKGDKNLISHQDIKPMLDNGKFKKVKQRYKQ